MIVSRKRPALLIIVDGVFLVTVDTQVLFQVLDTGIWQCSFTLK